MAERLKSCKDCNELVSYRAATCPHCGAPVRWNPLLVLTGLLFVAAQVRHEHYDISAMLTFFLCLLLLVNIRPPK
jgi:prepilin signal peptidase PulO-like enzyme (type II secretory pathway)